MHQYPSFVFHSSATHKCYIFISSSCVPLPLPYFIVYPYSDLVVNLVVILSGLIISLHRRLPYENINDTPVYSLGKMLHPYIMCACGMIHDQEILLLLNNCAKICSVFLGVVARTCILIMLLQLTLRNTNITCQCFNCWVVSIAAPTHPRAAIANGGAYHHSCCSYSDIRYQMSTDAYMLDFFYIKSVAFNFRIQCTMDIDQIRSITYEIHTAWMRIALLKSCIRKNIGLIA